MHKHTLKLTAMHVAALAVGTAAQAGLAEQRRVPSAVCPGLADGNKVLCGKARFSLLADRMVRCEWSETGEFEDRPSLTFVNRDMPQVEFSSEKRGDGILIKTPRMTLEWTGGAFNETNFVVNGVAALPEDAEETTGKLAGLKGEFARADALSEEFKGYLRPIYRAMNLPENWQSYWQTRSAIASDPVNLSRHLAHRHAALKAFVVDFNRLKGKLPQDFASKLEVLFRQHGIEPNESVKQSHE